MLNILNDMAENYLRLKPEELEGSYNFEIDGEFFNLVLGKESAEVIAGEDAKAIITLILNKDTWENLIDKKWNGMTAAGREHIKQSAPLDFRFSPGVKLSPSTMQDLYHLAMHFFNTSYPTYAYFGLEHTRLIHGGNAVALAYGPGVRSAYYAIKGDEQINADEKDPWSQCFIVIGGSGIATINGEKLKIKKGMAVHVPPNVTHTFVADEGEVLEGIWLAYGKGA